MSDNGNNLLTRAVIDELNEELEIPMGTGDGFQTREDGAVFILPLGSGRARSTSAFRVGFPS